MRRKTREAPGNGDRHEQVVIKRVTLTSDGQGGYTEAWATLGTIKANVEPVRATEAVVANRQQGVEAYRFTARNSGSWATVTTADRLEWRGLLLDVRSQPEVGRERDRMIDAEVGIVQ